ncbi:MAG: PDZ domain-containing protein [Pseudomonadota bacterium]|nr:PDZ domain-containing protein [Pseudomonadota bacterium]
MNPPQGPRPTRYRVVPLNPHAHVFEISCTVDEPDPAGQSFRLPAWIPGSYLIREFARHFVSVRAECNGSGIGIRKTAKDIWQADSCSGALTMIAEVYAFDLSVRAAYLDGSRGYFNGPSVFVWPVGQEERPCEVEIIAPEGEVYREWRVATSLPRVGASPYGFGRFAAANYDELIDHPVEMGSFDLVHFQAGGARHDIAVTGRHRGDLERFSRDLQRVCQGQIDLFGGAPESRAPVDYYLFQLLAVGEGYGGLEHRSSTSLICKRDELPQPGSTGVGEDYRSLLGLASHEYFHTWNVKRIKPSAFLPYDLTRENLTEQLWAFEGITSYYDDLMLVRSGVIGISDYLELLGRDITRLLRAPGRSKQSVAESSFDAWIKYYRRDENTPNAVVSYYVKGALIALALDLVLRRAGVITLDEVMRALWQRHGKPGIGVPEGGVEALAAELSGIDLTDFFAKYVHGTADLPLAELLAPFGVDVMLRAAEGAKDKGGSPGKRKTPRAWLGAALAAGAEPRLQHVLSDGPAERAGLAAGDTLVAIDGIRASAESLERVLKFRRPDDVVSVQAFRRDELMEFSVELDAAPLETCWLALADDADADARARRSAWLGQSPANP